MEGCFTLREREADIGAEIAHETRRCDGGIDSGVDISVLNSVAVAVPVQAEKDSTVRDGLEAHGNVGAVTNRVEPG